MESRNQYLEVLRERYLRAKARKEKGQILDEYCRNTGQARKYVIRKIQPKGGSKAEAEEEKETDLRWPG